MTDWYEIGFDPFVAIREGIDTLVRGDISVVGILDFGHNATPSSSIEAMAISRLKGMVMEVITLPHQEVDIFCKRHRRQDRNCYHSDIYHKEAPTETNHSVTV